MLKKKIAYGIAAILIVIGAYQSLIWTYELTEAKFRDSDQVAQQKHEKYAKEAFSLGRTWGEITARHYFENIQGYRIPGDYFNIATTFLNERIIDRHCDESDNCDELPTDDSLLIRYWIDKRTGKMPIYSFRSGFINAFVEYMEFKEILNK